MREIVLDTETTGLDPASGHRIVEIGAVELIDTVPTGRNLQLYINPERNMPQEAFQVHGLSDAFLANKPVFKDIASEFLEFVEGAKLVIHNAEFDMRFINAEIGRLGHAPIGMDKVIDTLAMARRKHPGSPNSLDALCQRYRIDNSRRIKHGALLDSEILAEIYVELLGGRQRAMSLGGPVEKKRILGNYCTARPQPLPAAIGIEEEKAHAAFVTDMGEKALWRKYIC